MRNWIFSALSLFCFACNGPAPPNSVAVSKAEAYHRQHPLDESGKYFLLDTLGYPGNHPTGPDGKLQPEPVRDWTYITQNRDTVTNRDLAGKVYVADFFFTSCSTICPTVKGQMSRIYERFKDNPDFRLVSFTIDPKRDTPEAMKEYAEKLDIYEHDVWWFLYGDRFFTYELDADYLSIAEEAPGTKDGFDHTGYVVLVDREGFVRGYGSGLKDDEIDHLMENIELLLAKEG